VFKPSSRIFPRESAKRLMEILVCKQGENAAAKNPLAKPFSAL
jgi:hypothetical protein